MKAIDFIGKEFIRMKNNKGKLEPQSDTTISLIEGWGNPGYFLITWTNADGNKCGTFKYSIEEVEMLISEDDWCFVMNDIQREWVMELLFDESKWLNAEEITLLKDIIYDRGYWHYTFKESIILNDLRKLYPNVKKDE